MSRALVPPRFSLRRINKKIGHHPILIDVSLELRTGEIHALVGANGAGKSSLIRILCGADVDFDGELWRDGTRLRLSGPRAGRRAGVHVIYQELSLVNCLSATDNWLLVEERGAFTWLSRSSARERAHSSCARLGLQIDVDVPIEQLTLSERQLLEIARALSESAHVLVLDEPTSALSEVEAERLLRQLEQLRDAGTAILYVSHRMDEIYRIADRISVLRDGKLVVTRPAQELERAELVAAMVDDVAVGSRGAVAPVPLPTTVRSAQLVVERLSSEGNPAIAEVSLQVQSGEILGVCGLSGSGASELLQVLGGARVRTHGIVRWNGTAMHFSTPEQAFAKGFAFLPADRHKSVFSAMSILDNASLSALTRFSRGGVIQREARRKAVAARASAMALERHALTEVAGSLSGGNQQKLALLRCTLTEPNVLLLDEPTRGVDVAAKQAIYRWIRQQAQRGLTVLVQSSELDELLTLSDRVIVLRQGRLIGEYERSAISRVNLQSAMMGSSV